MFEHLAPDLLVAAVLVVCALLGLRHRRAEGMPGILSRASLGFGWLGAAVWLGLVGLFVVPWLCGPLALVLGLVWGAMATRGQKGGFGLMLTGLFSVGVTWGYASFVHEWHHSLEPDSIVELSPERAAEVDDWTLAYFPTASCLPELRGQDAWRQKSRTLTRTVAPLVFAGWSKALPVPAWIGLGELPSRRMSAEEACRIEGDVGPIAGLRTLRDGHTDNAISNALETHGLTEVADAPVFRFAPTKRTVLQHLSIGRAAFALLAALWLLALFGDIHDGRRSRSRGAGSD